MIRYSYILLLLLAISWGHIFETENYMTGIVKLDETRHYGELYYILFKSRNENPKAPLIWYIEGGPGQSSMHGLFYQNGPFRLNKELELKRNEYSFNNMADVLYVDQPLGTGFSNCTDTSWVPQDEEQVLGDLFLFISGFLEQHKEYEGRPLFILSQGYGSHFAIPLARLLSLRTIQKVNIQGLALGSPWVRPEMQLTTLPAFSKSVSLCDEVKYIAGTYGYIIASIFIDLDMDIAANELMKMAESVLLGINTQPFNRQDFRLRCTDKDCSYDFSELKKFLDQANVKEDMRTTQKSFSLNSSEVRRWLIEKNEYLSDKSLTLIDILESDLMPVYLFSGMYDWDINTMGMDELVASLHWSGREKMATLPWKAWYSDGKLQGRYKHWKRLYYVHAINAGHYVGMDVPSFTLDLMMRLIYGSDH